MYNSAEMHVFADSSHDAYSVSCFRRFKYDDDKIAVVFLFGKCKVYPVVGTLLVPCLEFVAAAMATRISKSIAQESNIVFERTFYWSDSLSTLHLIRNSTRTRYNSMWRT